jgi:hypothetical protein
MSACGTGTSLARLLQELAAEQKKSADDSYDREAEFLCSVLNDS